ncbi:thiamine pyrophosphate-dependent enzyme [Candidatus Pelagibacter sp. HIMB1542]|uniref:thiamine pyrophosphate-dependent enzyme n=1 Tax=Candidatus Pelagibacter sp. HIMB1542 TaxID=3413346 RepID=UPI003F855998
MSKKLTKKDLLKFETKISKLYEDKKIKGPIHLSGNNENQLIKIFKKIKKNDWVFSGWRNHYHALLKGCSAKDVENQIIAGRSMTLNSYKNKFFTSSIVGGIIPIALGVAFSIKKKKMKQKVWVFIGDMTYETGVFHECYKYAKNFRLPLKFVVEDNDLSTNTPTKSAWGKKQKKLPDVYYYSYKRKYPHHGIGKWILF